MIAFGYSRVSTDEQSQHGVSLDAQESKIRAYCEAISYDLIEIIREEGVSAKVPLAKRPGGERLLRLAREQKAGSIVILKLDRLFRNASDALQTTEKLRAGKIELCSITERLDTSTPMGQFFFTITAAYAEMERALIAERTKAALAHKRDTLQIYSPVPMGFKLDGKQLIPDISEQVVLGRIRGMRESGASLRQIAVALNTDNVPTKRGGKRWYAGTIRYMLKNVLYKQKV